MVFSNAQYESLARKYGDVASWAIWDQKDRKNPQVIEINIETLHSSIIMVGLNISAPTPVRWSNFHIGRNDGKLSKAFDKNPFRGSYMTDLIKKEVCASSADLMQRIRRTDINLQKHISEFRIEMNDLGATDRTLFVLFGNDVANLFKENLGRLFPKNVLCRHYAYRISGDKWAAETLNRIKPLIPNNLQV